MPRQSDQRWTVRGRIDLSGQAHPPEPIAVTIIDLDPIQHDLAASGWTDAAGRFELHFTLQDFNLQPFERERWPDVWVVFQRDPHDRNSVVFSRGFPRSAWDGHTLTVTIGSGEFDDATEAREVPDHTDRPVTRTRLTRSRLDRWPEAVTVQLVGVTGLQGVGRPRGVVVGPTQRSVIEHVLGGMGDWTTRWCSLVSFHELETITYDPIDDLMIVHPACRTMTAAVIEVLVARALVARTHFQTVPKLLDRLTIATRDLWCDLDALDAATRMGLPESFPSFEQRAAAILVDSMLARIAAALDDQAAHLDDLFRSRHPSLAVAAVEPSVATRLLQSVALRFDIGHRRVDTVVRAIREQVDEGQRGLLPEWLTTPRGD